MARTSQTYNGNGKPYGPRLFKEVVAAYIEEVVGQMLYGYSYELPYDLGRFYIKKNLMTPGYLKKSRSKNRVSVHPKRIGFYYSVEVESDFLKKVGFVFNPSRGFKIRLRNALKTTNIDYRSQ